MKNQRTIQNTTSIGLGTCVYAISCFPLLLNTRAQIPVSKKNRHCNNPFKFIQPGRDKRFIAQNRDMNQNKASRLSHIQTLTGSIPL